MADIVIIGAGAAGLFCAGWATRAGHRVKVLEHMPSPGKKLLITGKGRCNLTNACEPQEFLKHVRRNPRFLYSALYACPPQQVMDLFERELGVPLKVERGRRVFPQSDSSRDILAGLMRFAQDAAIVYDGASELLLCREEGRMRVRGVRGQSGREYLADAVVVATGGVSYQSTGSTGDGYRFARQAGHSVVPPQPSLVALVERGDVAKRMQGLSLKNVALTLWENEKPVFCEQGEMLFTHFGVSGPLVLSASAHIRDVQKNHCHITIDLKPALSTQQLDARLLRDFSALANRQVAHVLDGLLPASMRLVVLEMWGVPPEKKVNQLTKAERTALGALLKAFPIEIKEKGSLAHAVVTSGGVDVRQIDPKTMQSRLCNGLYFAGEVLDVDAYTGGYNLGIAFATAKAAALHIPVQGPAGAFSEKEKRS